MEEDDVGSYPQVFVVDSQANHVSMSSGKKLRWVRAGQKFLHLLVGLALLGLVVEGCFIYSLYKQTEELSLCKSHPLCQNLSNSQTSSQQGGNIMSQVGAKESNEIPTVRPNLEHVQQRPFAQLIGSDTLKGEGSLVLWENSETVTYNMGYKNGRLLVEEDGYYYLYSKVTLNAAQECSLIQHKVMRNTSAYDAPIELMKSKSNRCFRKSTRANHSNEEVLWNSFLAGIFHLQSTDKVFVTLENKDKMRPGPTDNLMGAFMIFPGNINK
ncbi:tumor necrosis factor ligand superfamily member 14-like [Cottoperca gobio]|uniref:Tumor necrosis factor ligand superfamily member 14-like n=1 Tax=Cottoperca gobio TaxID=56716 RepID=A0A6J2Q6C5_COTGO|nr:tumor necrosis factor ligand superfamily member 14-like [Cottoperca gobio]XP_029292947.1 tumor necrosis factor ligand superfamily member 14-like [Cottoperca gobio]